MTDLICVDVYTDGYTVGPIGSHSSDMEMEDLKNCAPCETKFPSLITMCLVYYLKRLYWYYSLEIIVIKC